MSDDEPTRPGGHDLIETGPGETRTEGGAKGAPLGTGVLPEVGQRIGPYELDRRVGGGGMGVVYVAFQEKPLRRRVALKLIKAGMDTERVITRFEMERQTVALLNHPAIAKVLDAGTTDSGSPFFVMEFVDGPTLDRYCDDKRLGVNDRLRLFIGICEGVQHAHQKGIIHRDLKPSNVLVEEVDGQPVAKIIDFGIARATKSSDDPTGNLTVMGEFLGTPAYMSPEQATGRDIDTRTDVYSLGVLLYEMLVGSVPLDRALSSGEGIEEILRSLREDAPVTPSNRLTASGAGQSQIAESRHTDPGALRRELRGDLDWIVMRALEKERDRRYPSVSGLAADVQRFLNHEPVAASPPSVWYRARKFVRRHRVGVAAAVVVALSLVAGVVGTTTTMIRALRAERAARIEAQTANRVSDFLVTIFDLADPGTARGETITAREILDHGVSRIDSELRDEPETRARLLSTMGRVYRSLGLYDDAKPLLEEAMTVREGLPEESPVETAKVLILLSGLMQKMGNPDGAMAAAERALAICEGAGDEARTQLGEAWNNLGGAYVLAKRNDEAREAWIRALEVKTAELGPDHPGVAKVLNNLGVIERVTRRYPESARYFERSLAIVLAQYGEVHPETALKLNNLATTNKRMGDFGAARANLERAIEIHRQLYAGDHADLASTLNSLGEVCLLTGEYECAIEHCSAALAMRERTFGPSHRLTRRSVRDLGNAYEAAGRTADLERLNDRFNVPG